MRTNRERENSILIWTDTIRHRPVSTAKYNCSFSISSVVPERPRSLHQKRSSNLSKRNERSDVVTALRSVRYAPVLMHYIRRISLLSILVLIFLLVRNWRVFDAIFAISPSYSDLHADPLAFPRGEMASWHNGARFPVPTKQIVRDILHLSRSIGFLTFSRTFSKDEGETTLKQTRNTSVWG